MTQPTKQCSGKQGQIVDDTTIPSSDPNDGSLDVTILNDCPDGAIPVKTCPGEPLQVEVINPVADIEIVCASTDGRPLAFNPADNTLTELGGGAIADGATAVACPNQADREVVSKCMENADGAWQVISFVDANDPTDIVGPIFCNPLGAVVADPGDLTPCVKSVVPSTIACDKPLISEPIAGFPDAIDVTADAVTGAGYDIEAAINGTPVNWDVSSLTNGVEPVYVDAGRTDWIVKKDLTTQLSDCQSLGAEVVIDITPGRGGIRIVPFSTSTLSQYPTDISSPYDGLPFFPNPANPTAWGQIAYGSNTYLGFGPGFYPIPTTSGAAQPTSGRYQVKFNVTDIPDPANFALLFARADDQGTAEDIIHQIQINKFIDEAGCYENLNEDGRPRSQLVHLDGCTIEDLKNLTNTLKPTPKSGCVLVQGELVSVCLWALIDCDGVFQSEWRDDAGNIYDSSLIVECSNDYRVVTECRGGFKNHVVYDVGQDGSLTESAALPTSEECVSVVDAEYCEFINRRNIANNYQAATTVEGSGTSNHSIVHTSFSTAGLAFIRDEIALGRYVKIIVGVAPDQVIGVVTEEDLTFSGGTYEIRLTADHTASNSLTNQAVDGVLPLVGSAGGFVRYESFELVNVPGKANLVKIANSDCPITIEGSVTTDFCLPPECEELCVVSAGAAPGGIVKGGSVKKRTIQSRGVKAGSTQEQQQTDPGEVTPVKVCYYKDCDGSVNNTVYTYQGKEYDQEGFEALRLKIVPCDTPDVTYINGPAFCSTYVDQSTGSDVTVVLNGIILINQDDPNDTLTKYYLADTYTDIGDLGDEYFPSDLSLVTTCPPGSIVESSQCYRALVDISDVDGNGIAVAGQTISVDTITNNLSGTTSYTINHSISGAEIYVGSDPTEIGLDLTNASEWEAGVECDVPPITDGEIIQRDVCLNVGGIVVNVYAIFCVAKEGSRLLRYEDGHGNIVTGTPVNCTCDAVDFVPNLASDIVSDLATVLTLAQPVSIRRGSCTNGIGPVYSWINDGAYPAGSWFMVQFTPRGSTETFDINWGDGAVSSSTTANETHEYTTPGTYTVTFTINSSGACDGQTFTRDVAIV